MFDYIESVSLGLNKCVQDVGVCVCVCVDI